ncbi:MAG: hypothetical protein R2875_07280 [Desulfobacterales bacterium]
MASFYAVLVAVILHVRDQTICLNISLSRIVQGHFNGVAVKPDYLRVSTP